MFISPTTDNNAIKKWTAANSTRDHIGVLGIDDPYGVAVDGAGNVYIADTDDNAIKELPHAFVDPTPKLESAGRGQRFFASGVARHGQSARPVRSHQRPIVADHHRHHQWRGELFLYAPMPSNRTGNISLLGQTIPVTQGGPIYSLGTTALLEGPSAGSDSVVLAVTPEFGTWTATANATWLHLSPANQSGTGSTNVVFSFDANPGATRTGTLTIAGQTLTVTQAGSTYVAAGAVTTLVSSGLYYPYGVAVDGAGNVYIADTDNQRDQGMDGGQQQL